MRDVDTAVSTSSGGSWSAVDQCLAPEIQELRRRLAAAEAKLAGQHLTRLGLVVRLVRAAIRQPQRRSTLWRDLAKALVDRSIPAQVSAAPAAPQLPRFQPPDGPVARPDLRVAVVLDTPSELAFRYEWSHVLVGPDDWAQILSADPPHLLFVESAWNGNRGRWRRHLTGPDSPSDELRALVQWCRDHRIPTVFWNKDDPEHYDRFLATARLFDHVFTVDGDRIPQYRADLGHDSVGLLPFAAQPRIHNPVRRGPGRVHPVAFAGTYVAERDPERRSQVHHVLEPALDHGLHIYSRTASKDPRVRIPQPFSKNVVASLSYEELLSAYTAYQLFLHVNPVTSSSTACARQLFELSAAQTAVVSAPAAAVTTFFGDDVRVVSTKEETEQALAVLLRHDEFRDRMALRAHRRGFDSHLYRHRVDTVLEAVGLPWHEPDRSVSIVVPTNRPWRLDHVFSFVAAQSYKPLQLVLVQHGFTTPSAELKARAADAGVADFCSLTMDVTSTLGACMNAGMAAADGTYVAKMDDDNVYGPHYLTDLVRAFDYTDADVVGKWAHFAYLQGRGVTVLRFPYAEHRYTSLVQGGTIVVRRATALDVGFEDLPRRVDTTFLDNVRALGGTVYSADRFNFVSVRRADPNSHTWRVTDDYILAGQTRLLCYGEPNQHAFV